jgi:hypothetical protein
MSPEEAFDHQLLLFLAVTAARCAGALDRAGLLTDEDRQSLRGQYELLDGLAEDVSHEHVRIWMDMLVRLLPPMRSGDS